MGYGGGVQSGETVWADVRVSVRPSPRTDERADSVSGTSHTVFSEVTLC